MNSRIAAQCCPFPKTEVVRLMSDTQENHKRRAQLEKEAEALRGIADQVSEYADRPPVNNEDGYDDFSEERERLRDQVEPPLASSEERLRDAAELSEAELDEIEGDLDEAADTLREITPRREGFMTVEEALKAVR